MLTTVVFLILAGAMFLRSPKGRRLARHLQDDRVRWALLTALILASAWPTSGAAGGRLWRLALGALATLLVALAAALWLRGSKRALLKRLPFAWLQRHHVRLGCLSLSATLGHVGWPRWPYSEWSWVLVGTLALILLSGVVAWYFRPLREVSAYVQQQVKAGAKSPGATGSPSARAEKARQGCQTIRTTEDRHLDWHRALTLALLFLLAGHILHHLYH